MAQVGIQSLEFEKAPYLISYASIVGKKEGEGPLGKLFDVVGEDDLFGQETWEQAESILQKQAVELALQKAKLKNTDIRYAFGGDLLGQSIATTFGIKDLNIPFFGLYGACSTAGESLSLAAMTVAAGYGNPVVAVTSSHFASAEKQFRFPLEYASQKPMSSHWTVTGSGAFVVGNQRSKVRITGITTGKIVDFGIKDSLNMGAAMAPAACDTIATHLKDFGREVEYYDLILTGDLGYVGQEILIGLLKEQGIDIENCHKDCGIEIFDRDKQNTNSGGSGCGCSATVLSACFLPKLERGELKRILFVPTGALLSTVSFNEGQTIPGIAHAVVLEHAS